MNKTYSTKIEEFWEQIDVKLSKDILNKKPDELDKQYYEYCVEQSGPLIADQIAQVDFTTFREQMSCILKDILEKQLPESLKGDKPIKACYLEYDPINDWITGFFLCHHYYPEKNEDDEWACDWDVMIDGPNVSMFTKLQICENFYKKDDAVGAYVYAHARMVIEFARVCQEWMSPIPICIGYHDQAVVSRIFPDEIP